MKTNMVKSISVTFLLICLFCSSGVVIGCVGEGGGKEISISLIKEISYVPTNVKDVLIDFVKHGQKGTIIAVKSLDLDVDGIYQLFNYVNDIAITADGQYVIYTHITSLDSKRPMWLWRRELGEYLERKIFGWPADYSEILISNPAYSQFEEYIFFSVTWFLTGRTGLARVNRDGGNLQILETDIPLAEGPEPSPDGSMILVTCAGIDKSSGKPAFHICLLDNEGSLIKFITDSGDVHGSYYFLPDGKSIVYSELQSGGAFGILNKPEYYFYLYDLNSGERTSLLEWEVIVKGFSNDSQQIIFQGRHNEKSPWGIYLINTDGTNLRHLAYFDEFLEDWYADIEDD